MKKMKRTIAGIFLLPFFAYFHVHLYTVHLYTQHVISNAVQQTYDPGGSTAVHKPAFHILLQPTNCRDSTGIILVHSHFSNWELRRAQRTAWNNSLLDSLGFRRLFVLFLPDVRGFDKIQDEFDVQGDILLLDIVEDYKKLALKHIIGLTWAVMHCDKLSEIIKMDDDIFVSFPEFVRIARQNIPRGRTLWMLGLLQIELEVERDPRSKWYLSNKIYSNNTFPNFLSGWIYFTEIETVKLLLKNVLGLEDTQTGVMSSLLGGGWTNDVFWIDDVWISGILAEQLGVQRYSLNSYYTPYSGDLECCLKSDHVCPFLVAPADKRPDWILQAAVHYSRCHDNNCTACTQQTYQCTGPYKPDYPAFHKSCVGDTPSYRHSQPVVSVEVV